MVNSTTKALPVRPFVPVASQVERHRFAVLDRISDLLCKLFSVHHIG